MIDDFLDPDLCARLIQEFPAFDARNAVNEHGEVGRKAVFTDVARIGRSYAEFDRLMRSRAFLDWLGTLVDIPRLVYDRDYIGRGTHENLDGQELDPHVDFNFHPLRPLHRRLNLIVFLNPEWQETWGGCLELESDPWRPETKGPRQRILPLANRCVVFETTESSWHGFSRIQLPGGRRNGSRRSIAVHFYTRQRAGIETAPSHSTIYVPPAHGRAPSVGIRAATGGRPGAGGPDWPPRPPDPIPLRTGARFLYYARRHLSFTLVSIRPHPDLAAEVAARAVETQTCYGRYSRTTTVMSSD